MILEWADNSLAFLAFLFLQGWFANNQPCFEDTASASQADVHENGKCQRDTREVVSGMIRLWKCGKCFLNEHVSTCLLVNVGWQNMCWQSVGTLCWQIWLIRQVALLYLTWWVSPVIFRVSGNGEKEVKWLTCEWEKMCSTWRPNS